MKYELCNIGHITKDKVVNNRSEKYMSGGTAYYFSKAINNLEVAAVLVTAVADADSKVVAQLRGEGIKVINLPTRNTVFFENIYSDDLNDRDQNVLAVAEPFRAIDFPNVSARLFHLGPLLSTDVSLDLIRLLAQRGIVSMDIQGCLRYLDEQKVRYQDWEHKEEALKYVSILKCNEFEMEVLTGTRNIVDGSRYLAEMGVKEVVVTLGDRGSVIFDGAQFISVPAFVPETLLDTTGCGDSYMAGYLYKRVKGADVLEAGLFGSALASVKTENFGPFAGDMETIQKVILNGKRVYPDLLQQAK